MNQVKVKINGLNLTRLLDRLIQNNICVSQVVTKSRSVTFLISEKDLGALDRVCKLEHKFYVVLNKSGIKSFFARLPYFFGTILALMIIYCYFFSISFVVFNVSIEYKSEQPYDLAAVVSLLNDNGIKRGMKKYKMRASDIQKLILMSFDDIEGCTVNYEGGNLKICVYPAVKKYELTNEDIVSKFYGIITEAEAYVGNLKVKKGDIVKEGDVLIENNNGASGKILAKVYFTGSQIYNENQQEIIYTGNYLIKKDYSIFGKILSKDKKLCTFSNFLTKKCSFYISKNFFLPIVCEETIFYEVQLQEKKVPFEENEESLKEKTYKQALSKVPSDAEVLNVTYSIVSELNYTRIDCFIETIINLI